MIRTFTAEQILVWAYCDQLVHMDQTAASRWEAGLARPGYDSAAKIARIAEVGTAIDVSPNAGGSITHPAADLVEATVNAVPDGRVRALLLRHAMAGTRPDWRPGAWPRLEPLHKSNGKVEVAWTEEEHRYCPLLEVESWGAVHAARRNWQLWVFGLTSVFATLGAHVALPGGVSLRPGLPQLRPWKSEPFPQRMAYERWVATHRRAR